MPVWNMQSFRRDVDFLPRRCWKNAVLASSNYFCHGQTRLRKSGHAVTLRSSTYITSRFSFKESCIMSQSLWWSISTRIFHITWWMKFLLSPCIFLWLILAEDVASLGILVREAPSAYLRLRTWIDFIDRYIMQLAVKFWQQALHIDSKGKNNQKALNSEIDW